MEEIKNQFTAIASVARVGVVAQNTDSFKAAASRIRELLDCIDATLEVKLGDEFRHKRTGDIYKVCYVYDPEGRRLFFLSHDGEPYGRASSSLDRIFIDHCSSFFEKV